ncbi:E2F-associated phosphoprotein-like [Tupaia chinensis]|uniref:E2F-associated phosphoprotein-like n=1 Tax=Tupaia chinensis TaxID=246437 RepID=UPI000FFB1998|nr:E2F-associated phosphoprotein-like [Tupaia chinensis]
MSRLQDDYDPYVVEEPSDEELAWSSSEDEVDVLLHGTPDQKRKLTRECLTGESESSSEDEFEKEMEAELNSTITTMEDKLSSLGTGPSSGHGEVGTAPTKYYDDRYSGSDSEDEEKAAQADEKKEKKRHRIPTNDELLYDPGSMHREEVMVWGSRGHVNSPRESCETRYRAMFVMDFSVNKEEVLRYNTPEDRKKRWGRKKMTNCEGAAEQAETEGEEVCHPVACTECATEVAVYDKDEVVHLFSVLASHS